MISLLLQKTSQYQLGDCVLTRVFKNWCQHVLNTACIQSMLCDATTASKLDGKHSVGEPCVACDLSPQAKAVQGLPVAYKKGHAPYYVTSHPHRCQRSHPPNNIQPQPLLPLPLSQMTCTICPHLLLRFVRVHHQGAISSICAAHTSWQDTTTAAQAQPPAAAAAAVSVPGGAETGLSGCCA